MPPVIIFYWSLQGNYDIGISSGRVKIFSSYVFLFETSNFSVPVNDKITLRFRKLSFMQPVSRRRVPDSQLFSPQKQFFLLLN